MKLTSILAILTIFTLLTSCKKEGDTTKPVIDLISPAEGAVLGTGDDVHFEMELSDDIELASYKVDIHNNFDGHEHSKSSDDSETTDFSYNNTWSDISGLRNTTVHHHEIVIPEDATHGDYHFVVYCADAAGNESYVVVNVTIEDEGDDHDHE